MRLQELLDELRIPYREHPHRHVTQGWVGIDCGNCSPGSGRYRLGIHASSLSVSCWVCGRMRLGDALAAASGRPLREIIALLPAPGPRTTPDPVPSGKYTPPPDAGPLLPAHRRYLTDRGFDPDELAELWGIGGIGVSASLQWRIFIPVDRDGKMVTWTTRAIGDRIAPRYMSAPPESESVPIKRTLYGEPFVRHAAIVVEGPADAWGVGPGAVATFGLAVTPAQVRRLSRYPVRVIAFDNEPAAQRRASALADALAVFPGETYRVTLSGPDPASSPREEILELRKRFLD